MIEFIQNYGLWIALLGVFVAMQWFGMGCCGGRGKKPAQPNPDARGEESKGGKGPEATTRSGGSCH